MKEEVPELVQYVAKHTECEPAAVAFYVEIMDDSRERAGCLVFYDPEQRGAVKIGAAVHGGTWGRRSVRDFLWIRWVALWTAFMYLGADHLEADVRPSNKASIRMMELMKFTLVGEVVRNGVECLHYRLEG